MKILAVETSTEYCSAALWIDGALNERCELAGQKHSQMLLPMVDGLLREAGLKPAQLDGIAFGAGPGSFTGLRIACGVAQGLALGADIPVAGICTLEALAQAAEHDRVLAALDARMGEVYHAAYEKQDGTWRAVHEPGLSLPQDVPLVAGTGWFGAGSGFLAYGAALRGRYGEALADIDGQAMPRASAVVQLALPVFSDGRGVDAALAAPLYLRDKVALKTSEREAARAA